MVFMVEGVDFRRGVYAGMSCRKMWSDLPKYGAGLAQPDVGIHLVQCVGYSCGTLDMLVEFWEHWF